MMNELKLFLTRIMAFCLITAIPGTILLALYFVTAPRIAEYHEIKLKKSVLDIFNISYHLYDKEFFGFKYKKIDKEDIRKVFEKSITIETLPEAYVSEQPDGQIEDERDERNEKVKELFMYYKNGKLQGIGFVATKLGYGFNKAANISLFICVGPDLETIKGIEALDHTETPGLGGRMSEEGFKKQFVGKKLKPKISLVRGKETVGPNEVHAITGASYTSKGIEDIINEAMQSFWREMEANRG
jgi:Na+-transporting NADH:ubiquinone oxidoreductase subunit NqrC